VTSRDRHVQGGILCDVILRNVMWNLIGLGLPLLVAIVTIPPLVAALGTGRFGVLTLVWAVVSTVGVLDFGLGRALTQQVSAAIGSGRADQAQAITWTGLSLLSLLGVLAGVVLWFGAPAGVAFLKQPGDAGEAVAAMRAMAWAMPFVMLASGLRGVLESKAAFLPINVVRIATGVLTFAVPWATVRLGWDDLGAIAWMLAAVRLLAAALYAGCVARRLPGTFVPRRPERALLLQLLSVGGWMTVTNVAAPLMGYLDRFVIGVVLSMSAVAWYATPQDMVSRLLLFAGALSSVLFPRFSEIHAAGDRDGLGRRLERLAQIGLFLALFPVTLLLGAFAEPVLHAWLGPEFAREGADALRIFCVGVLVNSLAQVPFVSIQARGRADAIALLHCVQLPLFVFAVWQMATHWGVIGAALAWTGRIVVDFAALRLLSRSGSAVVPAWGTEARVAAVGALALAAFAAAGLLDDPLRVPVCLAIGAVAWLLAAARLPRIVPADAVAAFMGRARP
jgi:O-antigen/teichoic acid export membrane protein